MGGFESERASLASAIRTAQGRCGSSAVAAGGGDQRRSAACGGGADPASIFASASAGDGIEPAQLPARLEQALGLGRGSWPLAAIRRLADRMLELAEGRGRSAAHELRWLSLCGFCLRPGFGYPGDDFRVEQARRVYAEGLRFSNQVQNEIEWWIFWGRVAGGLNKNQQTDVFQRVSPMLLPRGSKRPPRVNPSLLREMWRASASLEHLPIGTKTQLGDELLSRIQKNDLIETGLWCLARLGARKLFYGPINQVVPPSTAARWVEGADQASAKYSTHTGRRGGGDRQAHGGCLARSSSTHVRTGAQNVSRDQPGCRAIGRSCGDGQNFRRRIAVGSGIRRAGNPGRRSRAGEGLSNFQKPA